LFAFFVFHFRSSFFCKDYSVLLCFRSLRFFINLPMFDGATLCSELN
jgi:hypothetical protein